MKSNGYTSTPSVNQGQTIRLYVNTTAPRYRLNAWDGTVALVREKC